MKFKKYLHLIKQISFLIKNKFIKENKIIIYTQSEKEIATTD